MTTKTKLDEPIVITQFEKGIAPSPHVGFGDMRNLDISSVPGVAKLNNKLSKVSASTVDALVKWILRDPITAGSIVAIDGNGSVYNSNDSGATWSELGDRDGSGQGMVIFKNYLIVAENSSLDVYGPLSGGAAAWSDNWKTIDTESAWHPMIVSINDGKVYGGGGRYIFSIEEASGQTFAPGNAATFTFTQQALDLPANYKVKCLEELGNNLMIGTWTGDTVAQFKLADIFPWDRSSASFDRPLQLNVNGVHAMLNINNLLWILAGIEGQVFISNGVQSSEVVRIPLSIADIDGGKYLSYYPGSVANYRGRLFFGLGDGSGNTAGMGVWSVLSTAQGYVLNLEHSISTGTNSASSTIEIASLLPTNRDVLLVGWRDNTTYGIDRVDNSARSTGFTGYFDSSFHQIGTYRRKRQLQEIEVQFAKPLVIGQGIALSYRTSLTGDFVIIGTFTHSTVNTTQIGGVSSHVAVAGIPDCEFVQIRGALAPGTSDTNASPNLKQIILT